MGGREGGSFWAILVLRCLKSTHRSFWSMSEFTSAAPQPRKILMSAVGWIVAPKSYVQILNPGTVNVTLSRNGVFADVITLLKILRWDHPELIRWGFSSMKRVLRRGERQRGRRPCEDRGRDWSYVALSQSDYSQQEIEEARKGSTPVFGRNPTSTLILDFWPWQLWEKKKFFL